MKLGRMRLDVMAGGLQCQLQGDGGQGSVKVRRNLRGVITTPCHLLKWEGGAAITHPPSYFRRGEGVVITSSQIPADFDVTLGRRASVHTLTRGINDMTDISN